MGLITEAIYDRLANDEALTAMLSTYEGEPGVFTTDPVPGAAVLPYVVTAGQVWARPFDTKTTRGRELAICLILVVLSTSAFAQTTVDD